MTAHSSWLRDSKLDIASEILSVFVESMINSTSAKIGNAGSTTISYEKIKKCNQLRKYDEEETPPIAFYVSH